MQEAFAVVREASKRVLGLRPFDVQLIGRNDLMIYNHINLDNRILPYHITKSEHVHHTIKQILLSVALFESSRLLFPHDLYFISMKKLRIWYGGK